MMNNDLKIVAICIGVMFILDYIWITVMLPMYKVAIKVVQKEEMVISTIGVVGSYICLVFGFIMFVFPLAKQQDSLIKAIGIGAAFGFATYGVYNFTNMALFRRSAWDVSVKDIAWGTSLMGVLGGIAWYLHKSNV
jgi:uncharacterized membrane protein